MMIIICLLLMLTMGRCEVDQLFETQTVGVGDDVTLTCTRRSSGTLFWFRLVSGDLPKVLGKSFSLETDPRITATEEPGLFVLHIKEAKQSDAAFYFCIRKHQNEFIFLTGTDLRVQAPDPVRPGDPVSLQCSVLSENETCPGLSVCCLGAGSHQCHQRLNDTEGNGVEEHDKNSEGRPTKKCVFSLLRSSSSEAGTCFCAVATCEETFSRNGYELDTEALNVWDSQKNISVFSLLCAAVAVSLIVIAFLIYSIKKLKEKSCACCNATAGVQQPTDEDSLVYSAPTFTSRKTSRGGTREAETEEEESVYTDVRARRFDYSSN